MRSIIYKALTDDATLTDLIPKEKWLENSSTIDIPVAPFVIITWGERDGVMRGLTTRGLGLYVHDDRGDYDRIDSVIARAEEVVLAQIDVTQGDSHISQATWLLSSGDLDDPEYKTNMRYTEFRIAGR